jgi:hypothetical protein
MPDFAHFIFVDFENVQDVDLALARDKAVHVTLLIGAKQTKVPTRLAMQFREFAAQVHPVEVGGSGRNALDLTLALYLGREIERHPTGQFTIVSRDKDFDPMIAHLHGTGTSVARVATFAAAPAFAPATKAVRPRLARAAAPKPAARSAAPTLPAQPEAKPAPSSPDPALERRRQSAIEHLSKPDNRNRPRTRRSLLAHLTTTLHGSKQDVANLLNHLQQTQVLSIGPDDRVTYTHR